MLKLEDSDTSSENALDELEESMRKPNLIELFQMISTARGMFYAGVLGYIITVAVITYFIGPVEAFLIGMIILSTVCIIMTVMRKYELQKAELSKYIKAKSKKKKSKSLTAKQKAMSNIPLFIMLATLIYEIIRAFTSEFSFNYHMKIMCLILITGVISKDCIKRAYKKLNYDMSFEIKELQYISNENEEYILVDENANEYELIISNLSHQEKSLLHNNEFTKIAIC